MRVFIGVLVVALLAGCDREKPSAEPTSPARHEPPAATDSVLLPEVPATEPVLQEPQPKPQQNEPPAIEIESAAEPEAPPEPALTVKVRPPVRRNVPAEPSDEPSSPPLDLSLPGDWVEALEEGEPTDSALLPPLFSAPEPEPSVHVSGRLIPWVDKDETVIDGAQLDFEFRR